MEESSAGEQPSVPGESWPHLLVVPAVVDVAPILARTHHRGVPATHNNVLFAEPCGIYEDFVTRNPSKDTSQTDTADLHSSALRLQINTLDGDNASTVHHTTSSGDPSGFRFEGRACEQRAMESHAP